MPPPTMHCATSSMYERQVAAHFGESAAGYADTYSKERSLAALFFLRRKAIVMSLLRLPKGSVVLDVGCGPGIYAEVCVGQGLCYRGVDISEGMIREAHKRFGHLPGVEFAVGSMKHLPFPSGSFDGLLCLGALEYVPEPERVSCLREMARVVKPDGVFVFSFLNKNSAYWRWVDYAYPLIKFAYYRTKALVTNSIPVTLKDCSLEGVPTWRFGMAESLRMLRSQGLFIGARTFFALNLFPPPLGDRLVSQAVWVNSRLEQLLTTRFFGWLGMAFVIAAKKSDGRRSAH
jgi:ubiquinone/menaquinone biosynthesis C-methylase UbiE